MSVTTSDVEQDKDGSKFGYTWPPSKDDLPGVTVMGALTQALPLVHKYDCENLLCCYVDRLDEMCFPVSTTQRKVTNEYGTPTAVTPLAKYLEQTHLDFIVTLQALYGPAKLTEAMKEVLAFCLGSSVKWSTATYLRLDKNCVVKAKVLNVLWDRPKQDDGAKGSDGYLVLEAFKISAETFADLFKNGMLKSGVSLQVDFRSI